MTWNKTPPRLTHVAIDQTGNWPEVPGNNMDWFEWLDHQAHGINTHNKLMWKLKTYPTTEVNDGIQCERPIQRLSEKGRFPETCPDDDQLSGAS